MAILTSVNRVTPILFCEECPNFYHQFVLGYRDLKCLTSAYLREVASQTCKVGVKKKKKRTVKEKKTAFEIKLLDVITPESLFSSLGRYWMLLFSISFVVAVLQSNFYSSEEVFMTLNCNLPQEARASF